MYAEICRVEFQQVPLVRFFFSKIFTIFLWNIKNFNWAKNSKNIFSHKNSKKSRSIEIAKVRPMFGR